MEDNRDSSEEWKGTPASEEAVDGAEQEVSEFKSF